GQSVWSSLAKATGQEYETDIYADEFTTAQALAEEIIRTNVVSGKDLLAVEQRPESGQPLQPHTPERRRQEEIGAS
ncbi:MAG TPA: hypothetical protein VLE03_09550, partial [Nitrospiraceae bacterium]|nr:hypothetical protein [Nitrospiraceae bacterium]